MKVRQFFINTVILTAGSLLLRLIGIGFSAWISRKIGPEGMGLFQLIFTVYNLASTLATSGIYLAVTRLVAEEIGKGSYAAANDADLLLALHGSGLAQGADEIPDVVALVQFAQGLGGETDLLEDDGDGAGFLVGTGDSQGHTLAHLVDAENDELACLCFAGNEGGLNVHQGDGGIELLLTHNFIHF